MGMLPRGQGHQLPHGGGRAEAGGEPSRPPGTTARLPELWERIVGASAARSVSKSRAYPESSSSTPCSSCQRSQRAMEMLRCLEVRPLLRAALHPMPIWLTSEERLPKTSPCRGGEADGLKILFPVYLGTEPSPPLAAVPPHSVSRDEPFGKLCCLFPARGCCAKTLLKMPQ